MTVAAVVDPGLPAVGELLHAPAMGERLGRLLGMPVRIGGIDVIKHKPGRRLSLAYVLDGGGGPRRVFAKAFASDRGMAVFVLMDRIADALARAPLRVPRPLAYVPELRLLVTEFVDGSPLADAIYGGLSDEPAQRAALALAALHGSGVTSARAWTPAKEMRTAREWLLSLHGRGGVEQGSRAAALLAAVGQGAPAPDAATATLVHRDFYADQLWDAGGVTAVLDLDDARAGDPAVDVGNFLAHLELRAAQFPATREGCRRAAPVFAAAYEDARGSALEGSWPDRVRFYRTASLLRLAGVYAARERWSETLPPLLLDLAERSWSA